MLDRAEKIRYDGKCRPFYVCEQESFSLFFNNTAVDLRDLEVRIDLR